MLKPSNWKTLNQEQILLISDIVRNTTDILDDCLGGTGLYQPQWDDVKESVAKLDAEIKRLSQEQHEKI